MWRHNGIWRHQNVHAILLSSQLGKTVNGDVFIKATKKWRVPPSEESQRRGQKGCDDQIRNQTGNHDQHCVTAPTAVCWPSLCLVSPTEDFRFIQNTQGRWIEALTEQTRHHFYFPSSLAFNIKIEALTVRYPSCRRGQNIIKRICKQAKSWLTKQNLLIQWFEALDRNFCQQCRLRDSKKNEICRWNGFDVAHEKHFVDRLDQSEKCAFSQCTVLSLWQNTY